MSGKAFAAFMGVLAVVALLAFGVFGKGGSALAVGDGVPDTKLPTLDERSQGSLADYRGKWVLLNVWASWCDPCRDESPALEDFYKRNRARNFTVLGIDSQDASEDALNFVREFKLAYPHLHDGSGDYADELGTTGVPESFLVDPDGKLALHVPGPITKEILAKQIEPMIRTGAS